MGLGINNITITDDVDDVGSVGGCCDKSFGSVSCSICLEVVGDNGDRSWAKLQCGHQFHLDCIGSAFNVKGAMQCPNCRKIEKGQWLYANGCRSSPEFNMDDWAHDEDLYDLSYSEMSFGVQWCPFDRFSGLPSSFEEGEVSSNAYHDPLDQHAMFADNTTVSSSHPCPYIAYLGPIHPSSANSSESISDSLSFNNHWNGHSVPSNVPISHAFPPIDLNYPSWEHDSSFLSTSGGRMSSADQPSAPPVTHQPARNFGFPQSGSFMQPFLVGQSSSAIPAGSVPSPMIPPYPGSNARAHDRAQALQAYYQQLQPTNSPAMRRTGTRRSSSQRSMASSSDRPGVRHYAPAETIGRSFHETENSNRFYAWETDHLPPFSLNQLDRDFGWGAFYQAAGGSDHGVRHVAFQQRHEAERTSSQNWW